MIHKKYIKFKFPYSGAGNAAAVVECMFTLYEDLGSVLSQKMPY
jgi:hypothetical protein